MNFREQAVELVKSVDREKIGMTFLQKAKLFAWETGLGPVMNALPDAFGQQAVLSFPGLRVKYPFPCCEHNGRVFLALTPLELNNVRDRLLQNPSVELWLKSGWFAGTARLMPADEQDEIMRVISDDRFYGKICKDIGGTSLKDHSLLEVVRNAPCTGKNGPGSKAWFWSLAAVLLLFSKKKK